MFYLIGHLNIGGRVFWNFSSPFSLKDKEGVAIWFNFGRKLARRKCLEFVAQCLQAEQYPPLEVVGKQWFMNLEELRKVTHNIEEIQSAAWIRGRVEVEPEVETEKHDKERGNIRQVHVNQGGDRVVRSEKDLLEP